MSKVKTLQILDEGLKRPYTQVPTCVLKYNKISAQARFLYSLLLTYAWYEAECFPGQQRLSEDFGIRRQNLSKYMTELKNCGLVSWKQRGVNQTNLYTINQIPSNITQYGTLNSKVLRENPCNTLDVTQTLHQDVTQSLHKEEEVEEYKDKEKDNGDAKASPPTVLVRERSVSPIVEQAIAYYLHTYRDFWKEEHPKLVKNQMLDVENRMSIFHSEYNDWDDGLKNWKILIDYWFSERGQTMDTDFNINHFAQPAILVNMYYEKLHYDD